MTSIAYQSPRMHGGPDGGAPLLHDFSSNSNACGPCPDVLDAVRHADATRYPDAAYTALRLQLAHFHQVAASRVLLAASASEFIFRITAMVAQRGGQLVCLPAHAYGDYAQAAQACLMVPTAEAAKADLYWMCDPSSPLGIDHPALGCVVDAAAARTASTTLVLDRAYEPLRLSSTLALTDLQLQSVWQLWTPNKALGLTGVRGAYAIAPRGADKDVQAMEALCPSWPIGAHGAAMLQAWTQPGTQAWLADSLRTLREWKHRQVAMCESIGWTVLPSNANFFVCHTRFGDLSTGERLPGLVPSLASAMPDSTVIHAHPGIQPYDRNDPQLLPQLQPDPTGSAPPWHSLQMASALATLRVHGIKLRDCTSFGLAGHVRLSVQTPSAQDAMWAALQCSIKGSR